MSALVHRRTATPAEAADWDGRREILTNIRGIGGRAYPRVSGILRERTWLLFETLLPFLTTAGFVFVYRTLQAPPQYIGFVVLGGAMTAFWLNVMWMMAAQLHWERDQGNLELYFTAPVSMMSILLGMAVGGLFMSGIRAAIVLAVGAVLFDVRFEIAQWGLLLATFLLTLAALYGLGMMLASLFLAWGREAYHLTELAIEPIYFVSGLNFPVGRLGLLGSLAISILPLAVGLDAMRQLAFVDAPGLGGTPPPSVEAAILVVMTFVFIGAARWMLAALEQRARREGRLTSRWQ
ncbi:MAG TPA: ABC transporter permease [Candidatus Limnocylindrales bacterium]